MLPTNAVDVLDLGAGTGAVTRLLRERVPGKVVAAEPDARMRAVLVRRVPDVLTVGARAEALPFADDTFDAVAVSSAWHWMDLALTVPEAARVLRPGGRLGVLWNGPARDVEWVAELLGPSRERVGPASDHAKRHSLRATIRRPVHDARDDRDHLVHADDPRRAGRSRQHLQRGDRTFQPRSGWRSSAGWSDWLPPTRASRAGRQSSCP